MIGSRQARKLSQKVSVLMYTVGDLKRPTNVVENILAAENFPFFEPRDSPLMHFRYAASRPACKEYSGNDLSC